tara:strand:- start:50 stop:280 length:231 start_codon:yes stop_codon:yes gene_type:complete
MWYETGLVGLSTAIFFYSSYEIGKRSARYSLNKSLKDLEDTKKTLIEQNELIDTSIEEHKKLLDELNTFYFSKKLK